MADETTTTTNEDTPVVAPDNGAGTTTPATFTQADVDRIVKERLQREQARSVEAAQKAAAAAEAKALAEQGDYKKLYEKAQADAAATAARIKAMELESLRSTIGRKLGLPETLHGRIQGEDEAAIEADANALLAALPQAQANGTRYVPQHGGDGAQKPATTKDVAVNYIAKTYKRG
jgi:hypothetical protein